jgi:hypothetical protein
MKVLITGDRNWINAGFIYDVLDKLKEEYGLQLFIVTGDCQGVDHIADVWAKASGIDRAVFPANWYGRKKAAGPFRNRKMADVVQPDLVLAFHPSLWAGSKGTKHMVEYACKKKITWLLLTGSEDLSKIDFSLQECPTVAPDS